MAGQAPAYLPHLGLVLEAVSAGPGGDPAPLPSIGLVLQATALSNSAGDPWPLPHWALLARTGAFTGTSAAGAFALAGNASGLYAARKLVCAAGAFALTGIDATLTTSAGNSLEWPVPLPHLSLVFSVNSGVYQMTASPGAYAITGQAAALRRGIGLAANTGSYLFSGAPALRDMQVTGECGAFFEVGQDATITSTHNPLSADAGAYVTTGYSAALQYNGAAKSLTAFTGAFNLTGQDAGSVSGFNFTCSPAAFVFTFSDADITSTGHVEPTFDQPETTGGKAWARGYALGPRVGRKRRAEIAAEVAKKVPVVVQTAALDVAHEWLAGDIANESEAQRELQKQVSEHTRWKRDYERLLRAYHAELQAEQERQAALVAANQEEYQRMQRNQNAARVLLLMNM